MRLAPIGHRLLILLVCLNSLDAQRLEVKALRPAAGPRPVGPYSMGIAAGDFVFVSGQGVGTGDGKGRPSDPRAQVINCLNNVRNILRMGQMDLANIFSLQIYYVDKAQEPIIEQVLKDTFSGNLPPTTRLFVPKLPVNTPLEITAFAHRSRQSGGLEPPRLNQPSGCKEAGQFVQCGVELAAGGKNVEQHTAAVLGALDARLRLWGTTLERAVATNVYLADMEEFARMNAVYASFFVVTPPSRSTVQPFALPKGQVAISVIAAK
jgi:enamine deaminase RidA (YjgF/YER057c/UK114 family)